MYVKSAWRMLIHIYIFIAVQAYVRLVIKVQIVMYVTQDTLKIQVHMEVDLEVK